jgi:hypothetical protein
MRPIALIAAAVLLQLPVPMPAQRHFRYERKLTVPSGISRETCAVLDTTVFAHAASESLNDLRLYAQPSFAEQPFDLSISGTQTDENDIAPVSHLRIAGHDIAFDLKMPTHPYSAVVLTLAAHNFIATATVTGISKPGATPSNLGTFILFDLTSQHLSRDTTLPLQESTYPILHIKLHLTFVPNAATRSISPSVIQAAVVPPSREAQTLYTPVISINKFALQGTDTVATFHIPAHVPVQRLRIFLAPHFTANFARSVEVIAMPDDTHDPSAAEVFSGEISHVVRPQTPDTPPIDHSQDAIDMPLGANLRSGATIHIRIRNGLEPPLPVAVAQLEMRQRKLCFNATRSPSSYLLFYGDSSLQSPVYAYAGSFLSLPKPAAAVLGPERRNPSYAPRKEQLSFTARYPDLPWVVLIAIIAAFGSMALRRARQR